MRQAPEQQAQEQDQQQQTASAPTQTEQLQAAAAAAASSTTRDSLDLAEYAARAIVAGMIASVVWLFTHPS